MCRDFVSCRNSFEAWGEPVQIAPSTRSVRSWASAKRSCEPYAPRDSPPTITSGRSSSGSVATRCATFSKSKVPAFTHTDRSETISAAEKRYEYCMVTTAQLPRVRYSIGCTSHSSTQPDPVAVLTRIRERLNPPALSRSATARSASSSKSASAVGIPA